MNENEETPTPVDVEPTPTEETPRVEPAPVSWSTPVEVPTPNPATIVTVEPQSGRRVTLTMPVPPEQVDFAAVTSAALAAVDEIAGRVEVVQVRRQDFTTPTSSAILVRVFAE